MFITTEASHLTLLLNTLVQVETWLLVFCRYPVGILSGTLPTLLEVFHNFSQSQVNSGIVAQAITASLSVLSTSTYPHLIHHYTTFTFHTSLNMNSEPYHEAVQSSLHPQITNF